MFGYATDETPELMPAPIVYAHRLVCQQAELSMVSNSSTGCVVTPTQSCRRQRPTPAPSRSRPSRVTRSWPGQSPQLPPASRRTVAPVAITLAPYGCTCRVTEVVKNIPLNLKQIFTNSGTPQRHI